MLGHKEHVTEAWAELSYARSSFRRRLLSKITVARLRPPPNRGCAARAVARVLCHPSMGPLERSTIVSLAMSAFRPLTRPPHHPSMSQPGTQRQFAAAHTDRP